MKFKHQRRSSFLSKMYQTIQTLFFFSTFTMILFLLLLNLSRLPSDPLQRSSILLTYIYILCNHRHDLCTAVCTVWFHLHKLVFQFIISNIFPCRTAVYFIWRHYFSSCCVGSMPPHPSTYVLFCLLAQTKWTGMHRDHFPGSCHRNEVTMLLSSPTFSWYLQNSVEEWLQTWNNKFVHEL